MARYSWVLTLSALLAVVAAPASAAPASDPALAWPAVTNTMRPWAYWWWLGSAVDPANLTRELQRYRDAGLGGVHVIPIYGAKGYEAQYLDYLSPKWMRMLGHAVSEARRLGLDVDMTTGTGWCMGGPNVPAEQGSMRVHAATFDVPAGGRLARRLDRKALLALVAYGPEGKCADLAGRVDASGSLDWRPADGPWKVYAIVGQSGRQAVKRAAPGGEGPMLNPFYGEAVRQYLTRFTQAFADYQGPRPRAQYHDSYEYANDWSPDLFAEFERRRGYRLQEHLPLLFGTLQSDEAARVKCDFRETISDMMVEGSMKAWADWARAQGFKTRYQAHGSPGNLLDLYALADIPETEMFNRDREPLIAKFASSAAHVTGRNLVASETGTWLADHFNETLGDLKKLVDELFVSGINHVFYHGCCYSPDEAGWPGWLFYASTEMNPRNSIWRDVPALNAYIARCQSVLQSGRPDNDLLLYWPIYDLWHNPGGLVQNLTVHGRDWLLKQPVGEAARLLSSRGFLFDYVSDRQLAGAKASEGGIALPGGRYRVVVVPPCTHLPVETLARLLALAEGGATVLFRDHLPQDVPGLANLDARRAALKQLLGRVALAGKEGDAVREAKLGKGRVLVGDLESALARARVARETALDHPGLWLIRRAGEAGRHYFLANYGEKPLDGWISLATPAASALLMDPMTGRVGLAALRRARGGAAQLFLQLQPGESLVVRTFATRRGGGPAWPYRKVSGEPSPLAGTWRVRFLQGGPRQPASFETDRLASWTALGDSEAQRFAGTALYSLTFDAPGRGSRFLLELGRVCQSARVRLNGRDLGTLFAPPFRVPVEGLKPQGNLLEVEVTNVSANRIRDLDRRRVPWKNFRDINIVDTDYRPFDAANWPLRDSGLLGPVTLTPVAGVAPK